MKRSTKLKIITLTAMLLLSGIGIACYYHINRHKMKLEKQVKAMTGMNVDLSFGSSKGFFNGKDSTYSKYPRKKLVVFVDSSSCSSCFISHLTDYYGINDTLQFRHAELIMVLHPQKARIKEVISRLNQDSYPFWCIVDETGEFVRNNPGLPDNQLLHAFTLDEKDNVILVGNPTRNPLIKELLYKAL